MLSLSFYGGVGEIGGNKVLLEDGDTRFFFDFGISYAERDKYFEEYLKPRSGAGLLDLLTLGLLPPLQGIYRDDLTSKELWPRFKQDASYRKLNVEGVLLSHAHLDHSGYISFLREDIPVYCTSMTAFITKAMQDSGQSDFEKEVCYLIPREHTIPKCERVGALKSTDYRKVCAQQRPFHVFEMEGLTPDALAFWKDTPGGRKLDDSPLHLAGKVGSVSVQCFPVSHSIFGSAAFAVETSSGWVVYSGDFRYGKLTEASLEKIAKLQPAALICEGTNTDKRSSVTEGEVYENARRVAQQARGLIIADFGPRQVERLLTFLRIAKETNRRLVVLPRDAYLLQVMAYLNSEIPDIIMDKALCVYEEAKADLQKWEQKVRNKYRGKLVSAEEISKHQELYILCFSFFDMNELPSIMPNGGSLYIYSSSEVFDEEGASDMRRLRHWLGRFDITGVGLPVEVKPHKWEIAEKERGFHASGHASARELLGFVKAVSPKVLIPIHTEAPDFFANNLTGTDIKVISLNKQEQDKKIRYPNVEIASVV